MDGLYCPGFQTKHACFRKHKKGRNRTYIA
jgi:hypothetical protein